VYSHYPSRDELIRAVLTRTLNRAITALDRATLNEGPPAAALQRFIETNWDTSIENRVFTLPTLPMRPEEEQTGHGPILDRLVPLIQRGQRTGDFDPRLSANWIVAALMSLTHAAANEVGGGRMSPDDALHALTRSVWRILGIDLPIRADATKGPFP
ncbi:MAG: TetR/AcrR family transcriptional regulator, partial [Acidimicrobiia bacterium]